VDVCADFKPHEPRAAMLFGKSVDQAIAMVKGAFCNIIRNAQNYS
jgi:hypothetical protein